jgi:hypothetical protein
LAVFQPVTLALGHEHPADAAHHGHHPDGEPFRPLHLHLRFLPFWPDRPGDCEPADHDSEPEDDDHDDALCAPDGVMLDGRRLTWDDSPLPHRALRDVVGSFELVVPPLVPNPVALPPPHRGASFSDLPVYLATLTLRL